MLEKGNEEEAKVTDKYGTENVCFEGEARNFTQEADTTVFQE